ncbi:glycosyltransferase [Mucilaginibacter terrenus]|uniref:Glycosyltransferase n=1 Tax=Mucilaginibacter terrenus TaxID=2482727 RepID=A0A3E2NY26_9SPHI|nr:glycosyltransferase [Mucilaginibacter terrenus]RFZ85760.1 glycosyltransferase [Mucilaginibacter terrenus]
MRILWFTNTPSLFNNHVTSNNGGGWISSLEESIVDEPELELAISFFSTDKSFKVKQNKTTYYPIALYDSFLKRTKHVLFYEKYDAVEVQAFLQVIADFQPDIIHIFGSEKSFGLISYYTKIPVVIHLQGILIPYMNAWFPPGVSNFDYLRYAGIKNYISYIKKLRIYKLNAKREHKILANCPNFIGRTTWDNNVAALYNGKARYFYCSEMLRSAFYNAVPWQNYGTEIIEIITTISPNLYKGFDLILKTASLLKSVSNVKFRWKVFGLSSYTFWEKKLNLYAKDLNVELLGIANANELIDAILSSSVFVHPSYIDNSPNSVCEAQLLGIPVIATNTGGLPSIINHQEDGFLVPANDPFSLCSAILQLHKNRELASTIGAKGRITALARHNKETIIKDNLSVYKALLN